MIQISEESQDQIAFAIVLAGIVLVLFGAAYLVYDSANMLFVAGGLVLAFGVVCKAIQMGWRPWIVPTMRESNEREGWF